MPDPSGRRRERRELILGLASQGLQYGSVLLLLPLLVMRLSRQHVGLWLVFMSLQSLVSILDFGFTPTLSRYVAFVFAGVRELKSHGVPDAGNSVDARLLAALVRAARQIFLGIAVVVGILLVGPGVIYVRGLTRAAGVGAEVWWAWAWFAMAVTANLYASWYTPLLTGSGRIEQTYWVNIINRGGFALLGAVALLLGLGLPAVAAAYLISVILSRAFARWAAAPILLTVRNTQVSRADLSRAFATIRPTSARSGAVALGSFLISRFSVLVASSWYGLGESAGFALSMQVFSVVSSMSLVGIVTILPRLASLRVNGDLASIRRVVVTSSLIAWGMFAVLAGAVVLAGNTLLNALGSRTPLLGTGPLLLMAVVWLLEANHSLCASVISTANVVPFVPAAVLSGVAVCGLTLGVVASGYGIWTLIAVQGLVQATYNNWKWPLVVYRECKLRPRDFWSGIKNLWWRRPVVRAE